MLNLLIREDRHNLRKEYFLRFSVVSLILIILILVAVGAVLFSFFIRLTTESEMVKDSLIIVRNSSDSQNLNQLVELNNRIDFKLSQIKVLDFKQSDLLSEILQKGNSGIGLNLININLSYVDSGVFSNIEIKGIAKTRNDLVVYREKLSESELFEMVEIPFSSFTQNVDIPFSVNIKTIELNNYFQNANKN